MRLLRPHKAATEQQQHLPSDIRGFWHLPNVSVRGHDCSRSSGVLGKADQSHNLGLGGRRQCRSSSNLTDSKVLWCPDPGEWGTAVSGTPDIRPHCSDSCCPGEETLQETSPIALPVGFCSNEVSGGHQQQRLLMFTAEGLLGFSCSPFFRGVKSLWGHPSRC